MDKNIEQRIDLKFCIANGISCAESLKMLQTTYNESTLSKTRAYEWYSAFKSGRDVVEDLPRFGRLSTSSTEVNIAKEEEMVTENRHLSLREIAAELSVSHESIRTILNDCFGMKHVAARLVPKDLLTSMYLLKNIPTELGLQILQRLLYYMIPQTKVCWICAIKGHQLIKIIIYFFVTTCIWVTGFL